MSWNMDAHLMLMATLSRWKACEWPSQENIPVQVIVWLSSMLVSVPDNRPRLLEMLDCEMNHPNCSPYLAPSSHMRWRHETVTITWLMQQRHNILCAQDGQAYCTLWHMPQLLSRGTLLKNAYRGQLPCILWVSHIEILHLMYGYCKLTFWYTFVTVEELHGTSHILFKIR